MDTTGLDFEAYPEIIQSGVSMYAETETAVQHVSTYVSSIDSRKLAKSRSFWWFKTVPYTDLYLDCCVIMQCAG